MADPQSGALVLVDRTTLGPPVREAHDALTGQPEWATVVIVRRGRGLLRWDASFWEVRPVGGVTHIWMVDVGFGVTHRWALRSMRRNLERGHR